MMKKRWILLMMCACISGLGGCGKQTVTEKAEETETADSMKEDTTELCAYIKEINGNTLVIDPVEYISSGDSDRLASYKHTDDDMPDGYYIYNKDEKTEEVTLTDQTEYSLLDCKNYQDQLYRLDKHGYWRSDVVRLEKAVSILERAGFSKTEVTFHEYGMMRKCFRNYKKAAGKASGRKRG